MVLVGRRLRRLISFTLYGQSVDQNRPGAPRLGRTKDGQKLIHIVPVDRTDVAESQFLKQRPLPARSTGDQLTRAPSTVAERPWQGGFEPFGHRVERRMGV